MEENIRKLLETAKSLQKLSALGLVKIDESGICSLTPAGEYIADVLKEEQNSHEEELKLFRKFYEKKLDAERKKHSAEVEELRSCCDLLISEQDRANKANKKKDLCIVVLAVFAAAILCAAIRLL